MIAIQVKGAIQELYQTERPQFDGLHELLRSSA
jgi:hypothetical protein